MGFVTASYSYRSADAVLRKGVLDRFLRESGLGQSGTITATGASASAIIDTSRLKSGQFNPRRFVNNWARISKKVSSLGAAPEGEVSPVWKFDPLVAGQLLVQPAFSTAPLVGDGYQLWGGAIHPQDVKDALDDVLTQDAYLPDWQLLTEIPDGDMEQPTVGTDWGTAINAAAAKSTAEPSSSGKRYMTVLTSGAGGYQPTQQFKVVPGRTYHLSSAVRATSAGCTPTLTAYDVTNGVALKSITTTSQAGVRIYADVGVPAGCFTMEIRLGSAESGVTSAWDDVVWFSTQQSDLPLPLWLRNEDQLKGIFQGSWDTAGANAWNTVPRMKPDRNRWDFRDSNFGRGQCRIVARQSVTSGPVYIFATRNETAFSDDNTDYKNVDGNFLQAALGMRVFQQLKKQPNSGRFDMAWVTATYNDYAKDFSKLMRAQESRLEQVLQAEELDTLAYRSDAGVYAIPRAVI